MRIENPKPRRTRRVWRIFLIGSILTLGSVVVIYFERAPILTALARAWIINEPSPHADLIVVIGGGLQTRTFEAAKMYQRGIATNILIARSKLSPTDRIGLTQPERVFSEKVLTMKGVAPERIGTFGESVTSTKDEAIALREWTSTHPDVKSVIIPTEIFHTRRVKSIFEKAFRSTAIKINVTAIEPEEYKPTDWWQHEEGLIAFESEVIKWVYYRFKYRGGRVHLEPSNSIGIKMNPATNSEQKVSPGAV